MDNLIKCLNEYLSDLKVFATKIQNYHWNVKGKEFFVMHEKLEEYYDCANKEIDEVAEGILMLGGQPLGTLKDFIENAKIGEAENTKIEQQAIFEALMQDIGTLLEKANKIKEEAENNNVYLISTLMDGYIEDYSKKMWMIKQSKE